MKDQINRNAELKKLEQESMPAQPMEWTPAAEGGIVPDLNAKANSGANMPSLVDNVAPGQPRVTNPAGINGTE
jgi:hypothetical protein